jgi:hypothetical protein
LQLNVFARKLYGVIEGNQGPPHPKEMAGKTGFQIAFPVGRFRPIAAYVFDHPAIPADKEQLEGLKPNIDDLIGCHNSRLIDQPKDRLGERQNEFDGKGDRFYNSYRSF